LHALQYQLAACRLERRAGLQEGGTGLQEREPEIVQQEERLKTQARAWLLMYVTTCLLQRHFHSCRESCTTLTAKHYVRYHQHHQRSLVIGWCCTRLLADIGLTQMENLSPEEQKSLSQLYMFLVQNPKHGITVRSWADVQLLWTQYQTLIWRPAELLNGVQLQGAYCSCLHKLKQA